MPSGILITGHEGDLLHMIDAGLRMADGEIPHLDFMTPIGILGFAPIALFLHLGSPAGQAAVLANLLVCVVLLPATWWVGVTRLSPRMAWVFGGAIVVLTTALVHGSGSISIGFSMYYNRWCWAVTLIILVTLLFPPQPNKANHWVSPLIVGVGLALLALTKMTFFVPLALAILFILVTGKHFRFAFIAMIAGAVVAGFVAILLGMDFIFAYAQDLLAVARGGAGRNYPGHDIAGVLSNPEMLSASFVMLGGIIYLRKIGKLRAGLVMLILAPAFTYITFQNWGNDPKWLIFAVLFLMSRLPDIDAKPFMGMPARQAGIVLVTVAVTAILPSAVSLISSTPRAAFASLEDALQIPLPEGRGDLWMPKSRILVTDRTTQFINGAEPSETPPVLINGVPLPICKIDGGFIALSNAIAQELDSLPMVADKQVLNADILNIGWLMGDLPRVTGAAVWYYDDQAGFGEADFLLVPICPLRPSSRDAMVENMQKTGWDLELRYTSRLLSLYRIRR